MEKHEIDAAFKRAKNVIVFDTHLIMEVREQLQNDLLCYLESDLTFEEIRRSPDTVCEIVVENFNKLLPPEEE
tara:strand:- start:217 stop:435 length:219 start_codon:yes stop_codon:yes gene_type:complete